MGYSGTKKPSLDSSLVGDSKKGYDSVDNLKYRIERYGRAKKRTVDNCTWLKEYGNSIDDISTLGKLGRVQCKSLSKIEALKLEVKLGDCGNWMLFRHYFRIDLVRLASLRTCKIPLMCQFCAIRRAAKSLQSYLARFEVIVSKNARLAPYFMTLTVANGDNLQERFEHLKKSFRLYTNRRRDALKKNRGFCELSKVEGAVYSYELTNKNNGWHPHLHILCLCDPDNLPDFPIDGTGKQKSESRLSKEWGDITGDSFIVDFRPIDGIEGFIEVFKYALKFSDLNPELNYHAFKILKGKRLTGAFGLFHGVVVPKEMEDDLIKDEPYLELFYKYLPAVGCYSLEGYKKIDGVSLDTLNDLNEEFCISKSYAKPKAPVQRKEYIPSLKTETLVKSLRVSDVSKDEKWYQCNNCSCVFEDVYRSENVTHVDCEDCGHEVSTMPLDLMIPF